MPKIEFIGTVFSGTGQGRKFIDLPWVRGQIEEKLGFSPFPGTLNLKLNAKSTAKKALLNSRYPIEVKPEAGYCPGELFKASINTIESGIVVPKILNYPRDVLEVIAPICLRDHLNLVDGSLVVVCVNV